MRHCSMMFFFNDTATTEIYTLSLHDALPICPERVGSTAPGGSQPNARSRRPGCGQPVLHRRRARRRGRSQRVRRSEEHTSELQSRQYLVCRLLLEKKNTEHLTTCTHGISTLT